MPLIDSRGTRFDTCDAPGGGDAAEVPVLVATSLWQPAQKFSNPPTRHATPQWRKRSQRPTIPLVIVLIPEVPK
jgi:hypothetical protein